MKTRSFILTLAAIALALSAPAALVSLDFTTSDQYDFHFFEQQRGNVISHSAGDDANGVADDGGFVRGSYSSFGAGIVIYDSLPDATPTDLFDLHGLRISALFRVSASGRRLGFNFAPSRTDALTVDFQPNFNGTPDVLRVAVGADLTSSSEALNTGNIVFETSSDTPDITTNRWLEFEVVFSLVNDPVQLQIDATVYNFNTINDISSGRFAVLTGTHLFNTGEYLFPGEIAVRMTGSSASMTADFDNFLIVPEPSSLAAAIAGLFWLLGRRPRKISLIG
jgi:hypothetical protein